MNEIRLLKADEIECRLQQIKENGYLALLYKDARCDMKILDETFGILGWKREHEVINGNLFCTVSIWNEAAGQWISKQDVGTESNTEKEKGQASDSFKRACFNIGIGRELYTSPFIWIKPLQGEIQKGNKVYTKFKVSEIEYNENREITKLKIIDGDDNLRYTYNSADKVSRKKQTDAKVKVEKNQTNPTNPTNKSDATSSSDECAICHAKLLVSEKTKSNQLYGQSLCEKHMTDGNKVGA